MTGISEQAFLQQVKSLAYIYGWAFHHQAPMRTPRGNIITGGSVGFPDIVMAHKIRGVIFAELKTDKGKTTAAQDDWLERLQPHVECYLWRPCDIEFISTRLSQC
jgi:hypothetical protein